MTLPNQNLKPTEAPVFLGARQVGILETFNAGWRDRRLVDVNARRITGYHEVDEDGFKWTVDDDEPIVLRVTKISHRLLGTDRVQMDRDDYADWLNSKMGGMKCDESYIEASVDAHVFQWIVLTLNSKENYHDLFDHEDFRAI